MRVVIASIRRADGLLRKAFFPFLLLAVACCCVAWTWSARVEKVFDGDTFRLTTGESVRLLGIDTPETGKGGEPDGHHAPEATRALRALVSGREIQLRTMGEPKDHYGRLLALVEIKGVGEVNELMLREGHGWYYYHEDHDPGMTERFLAAQREAMDERAGLWAGFVPWARKQGAVTGNRRSRRFFPADSPDVDRISPRNRIAFSDMVAAFRAGYAPARHAVSWPPEGALAP